MRPRRARRRTSGSDPRRAARRTSPSPLSSPLRPSTRRQPRGRALDGDDAHAHWSPDARSRTRHASSPRAASSRASRRRAIGRYEPSQSRDVARARRARPGFADVSDRDELLWPYREISASPATAVVSTTGATRDAVTTPILAHAHAVPSRTIVSISLTATRAVGSPMPSTTPTDPLSNSPLTRRSDSRHRRGFALVSAREGAVDTSPRVRARHGRPLRRPRGWFHRPRPARFDATRRRTTCRGATRAGIAAAAGIRPTARSPRPCASRPRRRFDRGARREIFFCSGFDAGGR